MVTTATKIFYICNRLGNVRATIAQSGSSLEVRGYSDYYPYGMVLRSGGATYRYGYQGAYAEKDGETDWNAFELRMYDSRIARWLSTDPKGQYASPYVAMGSDPVNGVDPDGGYTEVGALLRWVAGGFQGSMYHATVGDYAGQWGILKTLSADQISYSGQQAGDVAVGVKMDFGGKTNADNSQAFKQLDAVYNMSWVPTNTPGKQINTIDGAVRHFSDAIQTTASPIDYALDFAYLGARATGKAGVEAAEDLVGTKVEQYALRANEDGFYPVMKRGFEKGQELQWLNKGEAWKFGTTKNPLTRYSQNYLNSIGEFGVSKSKEFEGSLEEALELERMKIMNYKYQNGFLPPGNKITK